MYNFPLPRRIAFPESSKITSDPLIQILRVRKEAPSLSDTSENKSAPRNHQQGVQWSFRSRRFLSGARRINSFLQEYRSNELDVINCVLSSDRMLPPVQALCYVSKAAHYDARRLHLIEASHDSVEFLELESKRTVR